MKNFSRSALFRMKTKASLKYFVNDCSYAFNSTGSTAPYVKLAYVLAQTSLATLLLYLLGYITKCKENYIQQSQSLATIMGKIC